MVFIPMQKGHRGFQRVGYYDEEKLYGLIDEDEFQGVIDSCSKIIQILYSKKRLSDNQGISKYKIVLSFVSFITVLVFLLTMYLALAHGNVYLEKVSYGLIVSAMLIMAVLTGREITRNSNDVVFHYKEQVQLDLDTHLNKLSEIYKPRGLKWRFNPGLYRLECHVSKKLRRPDEVVVLSRRAR